MLLVVVASSSLIYWNLPVLSLKVVNKNRRDNSLNAKLNPICHLMALVGAHHILHISRIRVK